MKKILLLPEEITILREVVEFLRDKDGTREFKRVTHKTGVIEDLCKRAEGK